MESKRVAVVIVLAGLAVGAAVEHVRMAFARPSPENSAEGGDTLDQAARPPTVFKTVMMTNDAAARAANEALRRRVAELEKALASQAAKPGAQAQDGQTPERRRDEGRPRRMPNAEDLEKMKAENPEQYAEFLRRREEFRLAREQRAQERDDFYASIDTRRMTDDQRENHERLVSTVSRINELMAQMEQEGVERTPEMREEIGQLYGSLNELYAAERKYLLEETARAVGYQGAQVTEFADQMQGIIDNTTMSGFGRRWGGGRSPSAGQPGAV